MDIKREIAKNKWRLGAGYNWASMFGLGLVITQALQKYIDVHILILYPLGMISLWIFGYTIDKTGLLSKELEYSAERNTYFRKYIQGIDDDEPKKKK